jgi:hypothetical protein
MLILYERIKSDINAAVENNGTADIQQSVGRRLQLAIEQKSFLESMNRELKLRLAEVEDQLKSTRQSESALRDQNQQLSSQLESTRRQLAMQQEQIDRLTAERLQRHESGNQITDVNTSPVKDDECEELAMLKVKMARDAEILKATQERLVIAIRAKEAMRRDFELAKKRISQQQATNMKIGEDNSPVQVNANEE